MVKLAQRYLKSPRDSCKFWFLKEIRQLCSPQILRLPGVHFGGREVASSPVLSIDRLNAVRLYVPLCQFNHDTSFGFGPTWPGSRKRPESAPLIGSACFNLT